MVYGSNIKKKHVKVFPFRGRFFTVTFKDLMELNKELGSSRLTSVLIIGWRRCKYV